MKSKRQAHTIITSHNNADFDAMAAIIAASKLYPDGVLVFPGSQERNLRNFIIQSATYMFDFVAAKDIDLGSVKRLVLVDTRQKDRVPHIQALIDRIETTGGVEIHAYDHHPDTDHDVVHDEGVVNDWGSTTTILTHLIKERGLALSADEATVLGLGIYEDTGSFTFNSTTPQDYSAAAWLKQCGMDLNMVSEVLTRDMTAEQVTILNDLIESAKTHDIKGVKVVICEVTMDEYVGDFALLVHKLMDMENVRVLFALGRMQDRIQVVARSRTPDVDVGQVCTSLGGGGHSYAASASVKDRTLSQVKDELFALLYSLVNPQILVRDLMSAPAVTISGDRTIAHAHEVMSNYNLKGLPVTNPDDGLCIGVLGKETAAKAVAHGLEHLDVREYASRCVTVAPESDLYPVMEVIMGLRQHMAPVVQDGEIVGVITRTDLINTFIEEPARIPETLVPEKMRHKNIKSLLRERLPRHLFSLLVMAGNLGGEMDMPVYAVGGFVRDIMLRRPNHDLDLVVEGDGIKFARELAERLGGRMRAHNKFKTAVVIFGGHSRTGNSRTVGRANAFVAVGNGRGNGRQEERVDVATARLEYYEYPAALPTVELSSIKMDLFRRDFTINALAVQLNPGKMGQLVDFFGAQRDIKDERIRVLHSLSFVEDPTRILRAVRFEQRFGFRIGPQTDRLVKNAIQLGLMDKLSGSRLFNELKQIMLEDSPLACFRRMNEFGLLELMHPVLVLTKSKEAVLEEVERVFDWYRLLYMDPLDRPWLVPFLALCARAKGEEVQELAQRFNFPKRFATDFSNLRKEIFSTAQKLVHWSGHPGATMSRLYDILQPLPLEGVLYLMARSRNEKIRKNISHYLTHLQSAELEISGRDIMEQMGIEAGPPVGMILKKTLAARLDGEAPDRKGQLVYAARLARKMQGK